MKKVSYLLPIIIGISSCKKDNIEKKQPSASYIVSTPSASNFKEYLNPNDVYLCSISSISGSTNKQWEFNFASLGYNSIIIDIQLPEDGAEIGKIYELSSKNANDLPFGCSYMEGYIKNYEGKDSAFLSLKIRSYDKHYISGDFSYRIYDGFDFAKVSEGKFDNVPVHIQ